MTKQNLITDEFLTQFGIPDDRCVEGERIFFADDMRAIADWQLRQVLNWLCLYYGIEDRDYLIKDLMDEMMPDDIKPRKYWDDYSYGIMMQAIKDND